MVTGCRSQALKENSSGSALAGPDEEVDDEGRSLSTDSESPVHRPRGELPVALDSERSVAGLRPAFYLLIIPLIHIIHFAILY